MKLLKKLLNYQNKEEENFHNLKQKARIQGSIKYKIFIVIAFILFMDSGISINNYYHEKLKKYENIITAQTQEISIYKENEGRYQETLFSIAQEIYDREKFMTGGVEIPAEISIEILVEAIKNANKNFKEVLNATENYFNKREQIMTKIPCIWPLEHSSLIRITSGFGYRISPITGRLIFHRGLDITGGEVDIKSKKYTAPKVIATGDGRIKLHYLPPGWHNGLFYKGYIDEDGDDFGAYVVIEHGIFKKDGNFVPNGYESVYAHMEGTFEFVKEGMIVRQGDPLGYMGGTGNTTGLHVHYEIKKNGINVNPIDYLVSMFVGDGKIVDLK